jgi:poly-gamma-glutamate synthesis protein (capsule biosynthesis protein)
MKNEITRGIFFGMFLALVLLTGVLFWLRANNTEKNFNAPEAVAQTNKNNRRVEAIGDNVNETNVVKILLVGDMMFDRYIRQVSERKGLNIIFQPMEKFLPSFDLVVGNLEGPITANPSISVNTALGEKNNYVFTFPSNVANELYAKNIRLVNIGNNHIKNFGDRGIEETKSNLNQAKVNYFGAPDTKNNFFITETKGIKVAFINYNQFVAGGETITLGNLQNIRANRPDYIIVYTHWDKEYSEVPMEKNRELARKFIDSGANIVIGTHPHVVGTQEEYRGKKIYYSIGNFIFDQYFSEKTRRGLAIELTLGQSGNISIRELPVTMQTNGQTTIDF